MKYFTDCKTLEELKKAYRRLAMENHPDRGGSVEVMQAINAEYEMLFNEMKNTSSSGSGSRKQTQETAADFISIIDKIINLEGITIEICGTWLWVGGDTKPVKDVLMDAGLFWASKKKDVVLGTARSNGKDSKTEGCQNQKYDRNTNHLRKQSYYC